MPCLKKSAALLLKTSIHNIPGMLQSSKPNSAELIFRADCIFIN